MFVFNMLIEGDKIRLICTVLVFMTSSLMWSQHRVKGQVKDVNNIEIAYANLLLLKQQDSTLVSGTSTNDHGIFVFENIAKGTYIIKSSFIGYKDQMTPIEVTNDTEIPLIVMEESVEALSEVEIVVKRPTLKREPDRLVFNVEKTALSEGNMMEVLRSTPSVLVLDDKLQVKGTTPAVFINDRKVHLSSSELLELLEGTSATTIKSVEVITNPSAKYDAESGAVVLNIVMAKNLVTGYNGSAFANYTQGVFPKSSYGMSHYFKNSKTNLFFNYSYRDSKINRENKELIYYPQELWTTNLNRNTWSETHNFGMNFDYDLNDKHQIALAANAQFLPYFKYLTRGNTQIDPAINDISSFNSLNLSRDNKHNIGVDLDYKYKFSERSKLSFNTHYTNYDYYRKQQVNSDYFDGEGAFFESTSFRTRADLDTDIFTTQLDVSTTLSEVSSLETGVKFSNVQTESTNVHFDIINGQSVLNLSNTNTFDYHEKVIAGYINYDTAFKKFSVNLGLRLEHTNIEGIATNGINNKQDYLEWFPTVSLGYDISEHVNIYANYKRSLQRPVYSLLNPFIFFLNDNTHVTGNPNLQPIFVDSYNIGTTIHNIVTLSAYYNYKKNNILELPLQDNTTNIITYTPLNIQATEEIGFDVEVYFNVTEKWSLYFGNSIYNNMDKGTLFDINLERDKWANYSVLQNDITFLKDNSLSLSGTIIYIGANIQGFQTVHSRWDTSLSIRKTILKGKGAISLYVSDIPNKQDFKISTQIPEINQNSLLYNNPDNRYIRLGFRYKFGNTKLSTNQRSTSKEERNRLN